MRKLFALSLVLLALPLSAASKVRSAATGGIKTEVYLSGTITEAATGMPARHVQVYNPPDHYQMSDDNGHFRIKVAIGQDVTLTFFRSGFELFTAVVHISTDSARSFQMKSKPTTSVRLNDGSAIEADTETVEFGYLAPFTGYTKSSSLSLCTGGNPVAPERAEIRRITRAFDLGDPACCDRRSLPAITVELKNGSTATGGFIDACFGYREDLIVLDHNTGEPAYIPFADVAEIVFP